MPNAVTSLGIGRLLIDFQNSGGRRRDRTFEGARPADFPAEPDPPSGGTVQLMEL
ncbi:MAG: hypothetical protein AAB424_00435 [Patescibacteria group bacterium]